MLKKCVSVNFSYASQVRNNPLNFISSGIAGLEGYLNETFPEKSADIHPYLAGINEGVKRAASIVKSLGHYNRNADLPFEPCDVCAIIDNCLTILHNEMKSRIIIQKDFKVTNCIVRGNEGKLHQAFLNLLANAAQAIEQSGTIQISVDTFKKNFQIVVSDNGCGIRKESL